ncbi:hypothetical protein, partial [Enterobacter cloacae complex sp. 4DZ3-17B2]|uniref:hypothetical protein n=1 Tax=Enterobacter cloacae complex sp. 4DZ3-17B2 TaxID=2511990 RepID=UPI001CA4EB43
YYWLKFCSFSHLRFFLNEGTLTGMTAYFFKKTILYNFTVQLLQIFEANVKHHDLFNFLKFLNNFSDQANKFEKFIR